MLFHLRVRRPSGDFMEFDPKALDILNANQHLIRDWIFEEFEQMKKNKKLK